MSDSSNNNKILYALIFILLLGLAYTTYQLFNFKHSTEVLTVEKQDLQYLYDDLDSEFKKAMGEITELKSTNSELDSVLSIREKELTDKKNYIASLIKKGNLTSAELAQAQKLIEDFRKERLAFQAKVDSLTSVTDSLTEDNIELLMKKDELTTELTEKIEKLGEQEEINEKMKSKIDRASIFSTQNVEAVAVRMKKNGDEEFIKKASQVEKLKVCFDILENKIVDAGYLDMKVVIVAPDKHTVYLTSMGSGTFTDQQSGEEKRYTYKINPSYNKETKRICSYWVQNYPFSPGAYTIEIYQEGYLIGSTSMELK